MRKLQKLVRISSDFWNSFEYSPRKSLSNPDTMSHLKVICIPSLSFLCLTSDFQLRPYTQQHNSEMKFYDSNSDLMSNGIKHAKAFNALELPGSETRRETLHLSAYEWLNQLDCRSSESVITLYHFYQSCSNSYVNWFSPDYCYRPVDLRTIAWDDVSANDDTVNDSDCCCCSTSSSLMMWGQLSTE